MRTKFIQGEVKLGLRTERMVLNEEFCNTQLEWTATEPYSFSQAVVVRRSLYHHVTSRCLAGSKSVEANTFSLTAWVGEESPTASGCRRIVNGRSVYLHVMHY